MASTRSRHIRRLRQTLKHFDVAQLYFAEMGSMFEKSNPEISAACMVAYQLVDALKQHTQRIIEAI